MNEHYLIQKETPNLAVIKRARNKNSNTGGRNKLLLHARSAQASNQAAGTMLGFTDKKHRVTQKKKIVSGTQSTLKQQKDGNMEVKGTNLEDWEGRKGNSSSLTGRL